MSNIPLRPPITVPPKLQRQTRRPPTEVLVKDEVSTEAGWLLRVVSHSWVDPRKGDMGDMPTPCAFPMITGYTMWDQQIPPWPLDFRKIFVIT